MANTKTRIARDIWFLQTWSPIYQDFVCGKITYEEYMEKILLLQKELEQWGK